MEHENWFDDKGNLEEYLLLAADKPEEAKMSTGTATSDGKKERIPKLAFRMFVQKLGKEKFEELVADEITIPEALALAPLFLTRKAWAIILQKEFGYHLNSDGLAGVFNHGLRHWFVKNKARKPLTESPNAALVLYYLIPIRKEWAKANK